MKKESGHASAKRAPRRDGLATRRTILEAAGRVFAERGYAEATSKDICLEAEVNGAAVNYYFGGKESLYEAVLIEAHRQIMNLEDLSGIMASAASPEEKLRALLGKLVRTAIASPDLWGVRVFMRELAAPSQPMDKALPAAVLPKAALLRELVAGVTGLPPESPTVQRGVAFVVLPCVSLIMFPETLRAKILPATAASEHGMLEDMARYALGGLQALAEGEE